MLELTLQALYSGILTGAYYALIALGLALVFGTMRIINLAHGPLVVLAAYIAYTAESAYGIHPLAAIPIALVIVCAGSAATYFFVSRLEKDRELNSLILTFSIAMILTNTLLMVWSADVRSSSSSWFHEPVALADTLYAMRSEILAFIVGLILVGLVYLWLDRSWAGRALRAVSSHRDAAKLVGVNPHHTELMSFLLAGALATFAGIAIYSTKVIYPNLGHSLTVTAFIITVLAGMGSIPGVLLGAMLIGIIEALTITFYQSSLQELASMLLFLLVLLIRPSGLFGRKKRFS